MCRSHNKRAGRLEKGKGAEEKKTRVRRRGQRCPQLPAPGPPLRCPRPAVSWTGWTHTSRCGPRFKFDRFRKVIKTAFLPRIPSSVGARLAPPSCPAARRRGPAENAGRNFRRGILFGEDLSPRGSQLWPYFSMSFYFYLSFLGRDNWPRARDDCSYGQVLPLWPQQGRRGRRGRRGRGTVSALTPPPCSHRRVCVQQGRVYISARVAGCIRCGTE